MDQASIPTRRRKMHGNFDEQLFIATDFSISEKWADNHPNESFQPKPPIVKKTEQVN